MTGQSTQKDDTEAITGLPDILVRRIRKRARRILEADRTGLCAREVADRLIADMALQDLPATPIRLIVAEEMRAPPGRPGRLKPVTHASRP